MTLNQKLVGVICRLSILATLALPSLGFGADHILFISQKVGSPEYNTGEANRFLTVSENFHHIFGDTVHGRIKGMNITVRSLADLPNAIAKRVPPDARVVGMVFIGHGSRTTFSLSAGDWYSGTDVADYLYASLKSRPTSSKLLVYFMACSCGMGSDGRNFQTEFLERIALLNGPESALQEVHAIAHQDHSTLSKANMARPHTQLNHIFYTSGIARSLYRFDVKLFSTFGRRALNRAAFYKAATLGVGLAVFGSLLLPDPELWKTVVALISASYSDMVLGPVFKSVDARRLSWVNLKSLGPSGISTGSHETIWSAMQKVLPTLSIGGSCQSVLAGGG